MKLVPLTAIALLASTSIVIAQTGSPSGTSTTPSVPPAGMPGTAQSATSARTQNRSQRLHQHQGSETPGRRLLACTLTKNNEEVAIAVDSTGNVTQMTR